LSNYSLKALCYWSFCLAFNSREQFTGFLVLLSIIVLLLTGFLVLLSIIVLLLTGFLAVRSIIACFAPLLSSKLTYSCKPTYP
jgi:hypothetical protein